MDSIDGHKPCKLNILHLASDTWRVRTCACLDSWGRGEIVWSCWSYSALCNVPPPSPQARIWAEADVTRSRAQARQHQLLASPGGQRGSQMIKCGSRINSGLITSRNGLWSVDVDMTSAVTLEGYIKYITFSYYVYSNFLCLTLNVNKISPALLR